MKECDLGVVFDPIDPQSLLAYILFRGETTVASVAPVDRSWRSARLDMFSRIKRKRVVYSDHPDKQCGALM
jgi:hypothetical protein